MSFFGFFGKRSSFPQVKKKIKNTSERRNVKTPKTEGTSVTYGQAFRFSFVEKESASESSTLLGKRRFSDKASKSSVGATRSPLTRAPFRPSPAPVSKIPPPVSSKSSLGVSSQTVCKIPEETIVKVIRQTADVEPITKLGRIGALPSKIRSNIAVAAASANKSATVVLPKEEFFKPSRRPLNLVGSILNDIAKVTPKIEEIAIVIPSCIKDKLEIKEALEEASKVNLTITLKSKQSESIELNTLKIPILEPNFIYNFFVEDEEDIEEQEDQANDPLLDHRPIDTPRYVELKWNIVNVTEPLKGTELEAQRNQKIRKETFFEKRGTIGHTSNNFRDSVERKQKRTKPIRKDGIKRKIVDIHKPELGFKKIANQKVFTNSLPAILSAIRAKGQIFEMPLKDEIVKKEEPKEEKKFSFPGIRKSRKRSPFSFGRRRKR